MKNSTSVDRIKRSYHGRLAAWALVHNFVDLAAMLLPVRRTNSVRKRVGFVKFDGVGDYIIWTSAFDAIRAKYPSAEYERVLIGNERFREFAEGESVFDEKYFVDVARFASSLTYRFRAQREIRAMGLDVIINPRLTREFLWSDSVIRCSGAKVRIGSHGIENIISPLQKRISDRWYTELLPAPPEAEHEAHSYQHFLGVSNVPQVPKLAASANGFLMNKPYAVLFIGAFNAGKRWPVERFAEVARRLARQYGLKIVVCGGPGEEWLAEGFDEDAVNMAGRTSFSELTAIIGGAALTITNDTAAGHIAVAQQCPVVVITPGNHVGRFFPYPASMGVRQISVMHEMPCFGCGWYCIHTDVGPEDPKPCIAGVTVEQVMEAAAGLLSQERPQVEQA